MSCRHRHISSTLDFCLKSQIFLGLGGFAKPGIVTRVITHGGARHLQSCVTSLCEDSGPRGAAQTQKKLGFQDAQKTGYLKAVCLEIFGPVLLGFFAEIDPR